MQVAAITSHKTLFADVKTLYSPESRGFGGVVEVSGFGKFREKILSGDSDANIHFDELCRFLLSLSFDRRIRGDHHIFTKDGVAEILNLQPKRGWQSHTKSNRSEMSLSDTRYQEKKMPIRYELIIYWSEGDKSYIVEVPELPGCMADGPTYAEAVKDAEDVIREWIETASELGRPIPEPRGKLMYA